MNFHPFPDGDTLGYMLSLMSTKHLLKLLPVNKFYYNAIMSTIEKRCDSAFDCGDIRLRTTQYFAAVAIEKKLKKYNKAVLVAPMGYGKTLTALYLITKVLSGNIQILVPPAVMKVWVSELLKIGLLKSKPENSPVLVIHSSRKKHYDYYKTVSDVFSKHKIVLCSNTISCNPDYSVIDECHMRGHIANGKIIGLTAETKYKYLSHTIDGNGRITSGCYAVIPKFSTFTETTPDCQSVWWNVKTSSKSMNKRYGSIAMNIYENKANYVRTLVDCIQSHKKIVVCMDEGIIGNMVKTELSTILPHYHHFHLAGTENAINKFHKYKENALLFIKSTSNHGLNILEEAMVILLPESMSCVRLKQLQGRLLRPNNENNLIYTHYIITEEFGFYKTVYAATYAHPNWTLDYEEYPNQIMLRQCAAIARLIGCKDLTKLPKVDGCVIFDKDKTKERGEIVLEWWKKNKSERSYLTEETIISLYNM